MTSRNSLFRSESGCFTCESCGKKTRQTGKYDYHGVRDCDDCIEMQEHENSITDNTGSWSAEYLAKEVKEQEKMEQAFDERCKKYKTEMKV